MLGSWYWAAHLGCILFSKQGASLVVSSQLPDGSRNIWVLVPWVPAHPISLWWCLPAAFPPSDPAGPPLPTLDYF